MRQWFKEYTREQRLLLAEPYRGEVWRCQARPASIAVQNLTAQLGNYVNVTTLLKEHTPYDDIWLRDTLPLWYRQNSGAPWQGLLPSFDGWSGVQSHIDADKSLASRLFDDIIDLTTWRGEGGMFSHNGEWILVGLQSLHRRNPRYSKSQLKTIIKRQFAPLKPLFFDTGLRADETLGHIDNMALFVDDRTLLYSCTDDPAHPDYAACKLIDHTLQQLPATINRIGLPLPYPQTASVDERSELSYCQGALNRTRSVPLLCSYVNVIAVGDVVAFPQYQLPDDNVALERMLTALPDKTIITVDAREFVLGGGGLHCISHSLPQTLTRSVSAGVHAP